jgi:hypothetical protein
MIEEREVGSVGLRSGWLLGVRWCFWGNIDWRLGTVAALFLGGGSY